MSGKDQDHCGQHSGLVATIESGFETVNRAIALTEKSLTGLTDCITDIKTRLFVGGGESSPSMTVRLDRLEQQQLTGPDGKKTPLAVRLDRLEQRQAAREKLWWVMIGALVILTVNGVWSLVIKLAPVVGKITGQ